MNKKIIGYTAGVFDVFHIGHLNLLKAAKSYCDELIVAVTTDDYTKRIKHKYPLIPFGERIEILSSIRYVDRVVPQDIGEAEDFIESMFITQKEYHFDVIFKGIDMKGTERWNRVEKVFSEIGVKVVFLDTITTSSTIIKEKLSEY